MRHHDRDPHDALNDYLDSLAGAPPAGSRAGDLDPDLRDGVDRFFALAEQAGATPRAGTRTEQSTMSTNLTLPASGATAAPHRESRRRRALPRWTGDLHQLSTALLIVTVIALAVALFGANGIGNNGGEGEGEPNGNLAAVPLATVEPDAETSSIPYPTGDECTIEVSRDEIVADIQAANMATQPVHERYEQAIEPSVEDAQAIMQTYREWQACSVGGLNVAAQLELQTPWYTANSLPVFYNYQTGTIERPITEDEIQEYADILMDGNDHAAIAQVTAVYATPPPTSEEATPSGVPIPANATPIAFEEGRSFPTIFAEDIVITGPDTAYAMAYFVNETTGEVNADVSSVRHGFVKVDGKWLIDSYREGNLG
jgi:hypothetical protein